MTFTAETVPGAHCVWSLLEFFPEEFQIGVLDIGAALSEQPAYQALVNAGRARIIGFEPNFEECERLNATFGAPHQFFPYFVGDGESAVFHETNWTLTGSLYEPNVPLVEHFQSLAEWMQPMGQHQVETKRLDDIKEISDIDFVKIDVQGAELAVFRNATRVLNDVVAIQTEVEFVEIYKGQPLFADVDSCLRRQGFQFHAFHSISGRAFKPLVFNGDANQALRQMLWSDALYVRDWMALARLPERKLRNYAILAHDVLNSYDLAHLVLVEFDRRTGRSIAPEYLKRLTAGG